MRFLSTTKTARINALAFSCESRKLAAACDGANVRVWALDSDSRPTTRKATRDAAFVGYLGDSDRLVVASHGSADCWDTPAGPPRRVIPPRDGFHDIDSSPDGRRIVRLSHEFGARSDTLECYGSGDGRELWRVECERHPGLIFQRVRFDASGTKVHAAGHRVAAYDAISGAELAGFDWEYSAPPYWVAAADFSPDGRQFALLAGHRLQVRDTTTGNLVFEGEFETYRVNTVGFTPDGTRVATACGHPNNGDRIDFWDTATWQRLPALDFGIGRVTALAFSPDGLLGAAGGNNGQIVLWDL